MKKVLLIVAIIGVFSVSTFAHYGFSYRIASYKPGPGSAYYLSNVTSDGTLLHGNISGGVYEWDVDLDANDDGTVGDPLNYSNLNQSEGPGTKQGCKIGDYYFWGSSSNKGVWRMNDAWDTKVPTTGYKQTDDGSETVTTDGTYLYGNDDYERGELHKWQITNTETDFTLTEVWASDSDGEGLETGYGRIRGISYWDGGIYFGDYNADGSGKYRIGKATTGGVGVVVTVGELPSSATSGVYGVVRYGEEGFVAGGYNEKVYIYDVSGGGTSETWTLQTDGEYALGLDDVWGVAVTGNGQVATNVWITTRGAPSGTSGSGGYCLSSYELRHNGDADEDGSVGGSDLNAVLSNWGASGLTGLASWGAGDFDGDGGVGGSDLNAVLSEWGWSKPSGPSAVPEPATLGLLLIGFVGLLRRKK